MKMLHELTYDEVDTLLRENQALENMMFERAMDSACFWLEEYLDGCKCDCIIGDRGAHFTIVNVDDFSEWYEKLQTAFCFLGDEENALIHRYLDRYNLYVHVRDYTWAKEKDIDALYESVERLQEQAEDIIFNRLASEWNYGFERERWIEEFEIWAEDYPEAYVKDGEIFQHVPEHTIPAHEERIA